MSPQTIGWVMDKDTSTRRLHLYRKEEGVLGLTLEVSGQPSASMALDLAGVMVLQRYVVQACTMLSAEEGA